MSQVIIRLRAQVKFREEEDPGGVSVLGKIGTLESYEELAKWIGARQLQLLMAILLVPSCFLGSS